MVTQLNALAAGHWAQPAAAAAGAPADTMALRIHRTSLDTTRKQLFIYNGESNVEIVSSWISALSAVHSICGLLTNHDGTFSDYLFLMDMAAPMLNDVCIEWHNATVNKTTALAQAPNDGLWVWYRDHFFAH